MNSIYNAQLAMHVKEDEIEIPAIYCFFNRSYKLPYQGADEVRNPVLYDTLKTSPNDLVGFIGARGRALRNRRKVRMRDVSKVERLTLPCRTTDSELEIVTFYVDKLFEKADFQRGVIFVPAQELAENNQKSWEIFLPIDGRNRKIDIGVKIAANYFLRKDVEVPAVS
ncbi:MAG: hypothetical protein ABIE55_01055 [Candidatus Aenigmatarchaeota archaeon]